MPTPGATIHATKTTRPVLAQRKAGPVPDEPRDIAAPPEPSEWAVAAHQAAGPRRGAVRAWKLDVPSGVVPPRSSWLPNPRTPGPSWVRRGYGPGGGLTPYDSD